MRESKAENNEYLKNAILGLADGLTVPFALTAGLSSLGSTKLVITAGLAELISGSVSMGLGAYLAALSERQRYDTKYLQGEREVSDEPDVEREEIYNILCAYGIRRESVKPFVEALCQDQAQWTKFVVEFKLKLERPQRITAYYCALVMGFAYFIGGLFPMIPYFAVQETTTALFISIGITACILVLFGFAKSRLVGCSARQSSISAVQTLFVGAVAAGASYGIVRAINNDSIA